MAITIEEFLRGLGGETVTGVLAIGGIIALVTGVVKFFEPPDGFCSVDWHKEQWSARQSRKYFEEKARFEKLRASGSRGSNNYVVLLVGIALLISIIIGGPVSNLISGQPFNIQAILISTWLTVTVIIVRWVAYLSRRAERYVAFLNGNETWMYSPKLRK